MLATTLGTAHTEAEVASSSPIYFGVDWFVLNVIFTGILFVPIEMLFPRRRGQELFRYDWREDLFYYFVSSMMVQILTFVSLLPALQLTAHTNWTALRSVMSAQPLCCSSSRSCS